MEEHSVEGQSVGQFETHHHHTGYPEEENIQSSFKKGRRIECFEIGSIVRPSHDREREQSRRKPSIQYIFISFQDKFVLGTTQELQCLLLGLCL